MRILGIIVVALALAGCGTNKTLVVEETTRVAMPPAGLWECPDAPRPPDGHLSWTQAEVADYVLQLYEAHEVCQESIKDVRAWLIEAEKITEEGK
jgi:hypothetical protein